MTELDDLLERWAQTQRLSPVRSAAVHDRVLALARADDDLDVDWMRDLLRPVTNLLDGPHALQRTITRSLVRSGGV